VLSTVRVIKDENEVSLQSREDNTSMYQITRDDHNNIEIHAVWQGQTQ
jgi:hypothetical protein